MLSILNNYDLPTLVTDGALVITVLAVFYLTVIKKRSGKLFSWLVVLLSIKVGNLIWVYWHWWTELAGRAEWRNLLPPHSLFYLRQVETAVTGLAVSWLAALLLFWVLTRFFIIRHKGAFLDGTDVMLLVIGAVAVGWPAVLIYLAAVFALSVVAMIVLVIIRRKSLQDRLIITPYIIPAAIMVLIFQHWLLQVTYLWKIGF